MRLIDADILKERVSEMIVPEWVHTLVRTLIDDNATIDAVPMVRCGECRYFTETDEVHGIKAGVCMWWQSRHMPKHGLMRADHFCADGERKDGEHEERNVIR